MVLEYVPGGELSRYVKASTYPLPELVARTVIAEIIAAVGYLHQQGIIYRDLKPENVLVDALGHMRLTDFGLAKENMAGVSTKTFCGTPDFQAPEIIRGDYYDLSVDWWSVGCILYELLYRVSPFYAVSRHMVYSKIIDAQYSFPSEARLPVSDDAKDLVRQFLQKEPSERLCEYSKIKDHPFFAGVDWAAVETGRAQPAFVPRLPRRDPKDIGEPIDTLLLKELASSTAGFHSPTDLYLDGF
jgi:serine/threonine protein kinase